MQFKYNTNFIITIAFRGFEIYIIIYIMMDEIKEYINSDGFVNETTKYLIREYVDTKFGFGNYARFGSVIILNTSVAIRDLDNLFHDFYCSSPNAEYYCKYYHCYYPKFIDLAVRKTKEIASSAKFIKLVKQHLIDCKLRQINYDFK